MHNPLNFTPTSRAPRGKGPRTKKAVRRLRQRQAEEAQGTLRWHRGELVPESNLSEATDNRPAVTRYL